MLPCESLDRRRIRQVLRSEHVRGPGIESDPIGIRDAMRRLTGYDPPWRLQLS